MKRLIKFLKSLGDVYTVTDFYRDLRAAQERNREELVRVLEILERLRLSR